MDLLSDLAGGDRRSIGRVSAVVPFVLDHPEQLPVLIEGMESEDEVLRMRCADAAEKISISKPDWFVPLRSRLLRLARTSAQQELRWHIAQMLPRIGLDAFQRDVAIAVLLEYLSDKSRIVRSCPRKWCSFGARRAFRTEPGTCQLAAGRLMSGSSLIVAIVSSVM